jgi:poly-beta-hydroxybutyrate-responsive repressor
MSVDGTRNPQADTHAASNGHRNPEAPPKPRNWLQPFLLLALQQWQSHGYELMHRLTLFGFEALDPGSVYRTLRQLERDGLVRSDWDMPSHGPARRTYTLTDAGTAYLDAWAAALAGYRSMLDGFFGLYGPDDGASGTPAEATDRPSFREAADR